MRTTWLAVLAGCGAPAWEGVYETTEVAVDSCYGVEVGAPLEVRGKGDTFALTVVGGIWDCTFDDDALTFGCAGPTDAGQIEAGVADGSVTDGDAPRLDLIASEVFAEETCALSLVATWSRGLD